MIRKWLLVALVSIFPGLALASDCSGTITTGGTAQNVTVAGTTTPIGNVRGVLLMNNSANLMCISFNGAAATIAGTNCGSGSWVLQPGSATAAGGSFSKPENISISVVSIISSTTADRYSCEFMR